MKEKYDIILLMTKQMDNEKIVKGLLKFMTKDAVICTMQNGLPELSVSEVIGKEKLLDVLCLGELLLLEMEFVN